MAAHVSADDLKKQTQLQHPDSDDDWIPDPEVLQRLQAKYGTADHPMFMTDITYKDVETNDDIAALCALRDEMMEDIPAYMQMCKEHGNEFFQEANNLKDNNLKLKAYMNAAICYTRGIDLPEDRSAEMDDKLLSQLCSNRALVHITLHDWLSAARDCRKSIKKDSTNIKAYMRCARALYTLELYRELLSITRKGLAIEPNNSVLATYLEKATDELEKRQTVNRKEAEKEIVEGILLSRKLVVEEEGPYVGMTNSLISKHPLKPCDCPEEYRVLNSLHWVGLFLFPIYDVAESLIDFCDTNAIGTSLYVLIGEGTAPWDIDHVYAYNNIIAYLEGGSEDDSLVKVEEPHLVPLRSVMDFTKKISQTPIFHILPAHNDEYIKKFESEFVIIKYTKSV